MIGPAVTRDEWEIGPGRRRLPIRTTAGSCSSSPSIPVREFPVIGPDGAVHVEPFYTVMGFAANEDGVAILARASQKQVVNVAQHGGICGVLVSHSRPTIGRPARRTARASVASRPECRRWRAIGVNVSAAGPVSAGRLICGRLSHVAASDAAHWPRFRAF